jgi:hypothetical protein
MWSAFTRLAVVALVLTGCGARSLDVSLTIDTSSCTLSIPAGGSVLYQVEANGTSAVGSFCGGCLAVDSAISSGDAMVAFLRAHAPSCAGVHPGTTLGVRLTGFSAAGCPGGNTPQFCADGPTVLVPDGTSDAALNLALTCRAQCSAMCVPTTCAMQAKDCGPISDGCNMVLDCGTCHPPQRCGATTPNVCGR